MVWWRGRLPGQAEAARESFDLRSAGRRAAWEVPAGRPGRRPLVAEDACCMFVFRVHIVCKA